MRNYVNGLDLSISAKSLKLLRSTLSFLKHQNCRWLCSHKAYFSLNQWLVCLILPVTQYMLQNALQKQLLLSLADIVENVRHKETSQDWTPPTSHPEFHPVGDSGPLYCHLGHFQHLVLFLNKSSCFLLPLLSNWSLCAVCTALLCSTINIQELNLVYPYCSEEYYPGFTSSAHF